MKQQLRKVAVMDLRERLRSEEPVRKNKGGPWRMVGDGAIVVYRRLIINPG